MLYPLSYKGIAGTLKRAPWLADQDSNLEPSESESDVLPIAPPAKKALVKRHITANHGGVVTCVGGVDTPTTCLR